MARFVDTAWDRRPNDGFCCAKLPGAPSGAAAARIGVSRRDFAREIPVPDNVFTAYRGLYANDRENLDAGIDSVRFAGDGPDAGETGFLVGLALGRA